MFSLLRFSEETIGRYPWRYLIDHPHVALPSMDAVLLPPSQLSVGPLNDTRQEINIARRRERSGIEAMSSCMHIL